MALDNQLDPLFNQEFFLDNGVDVVLDLNTYANVSWAVSGVWSGSIQVYGSVNGETDKYDQLTFMSASSGARVQNITGVGQWTFPGKGYRFYKFTFGSWTSGTAHLRVFGSIAPYLAAENYQVRDINSNVITITTTKQQTLRNAVTKGVLIQVLVTAVVGTVPWPEMRIIQTIDSQSYTLAGPRTKAGNISANQFVSWLIYPGASGGSADFVDPCPLPRSSILQLVWTLPGGASITYTCVNDYLVA